MHPAKCQRFMFVAPHKVISRYAFKQPVNQLLARACQKQVLYFATGQQMAVMKENDFTHMTIKIWQNVSKVNMQNSTFDENVGTVISGL